MKQSIFIDFIIKEAKHILRDKRTMLILFGMPIIMMLIFGFAIRNDVKDVRTVLVTSSADILTQKVVTTLNASEYFSIVATAATSASAEQMIRNQQADMALVFSSSFADRQAKGAQIQLITDATDPNMAQIYANYARQIIQDALLQAVKGGSSTAVGINIKCMYNPRMESAYNFVPGIMGMLLILICAMMTSVSIVREKEKGTMEVLLASPVHPLLVILAKAIPYFVLAFAILVSILLMAFYLLGVPLAGSLLWIVVVSLLYILLSLSLGLLISTIAQTQLVALLMSAMILLLPTVLLSGMIYPIESMPAILQYVSFVIPARWYISAMRKLMIMGVDINNVLPEVSVLLFFTASLLTISLVKFKTRLE